MKSNFIHPVPLPVPGMLGATNSYLIVNGRRVALIDTGMASEQNILILEEKLKALGHTFGSLDKVVCTHYHPDHCGLGKLFQDAGTEVWLSEIDIESLAIWQASADMDGQMATMFGRHALPANFAVSVKPAFAFLRTLQQAFDPTALGAEGGAIIELAGIPFEVIHTPGHTDGHVCLFQPDARALLTGDHVLPDTVVNIAMRAHSRYDSPLQQYLHSLKKISAVGDCRGFSGHGDAFDGVGRRCEALIAIHQNKIAQVAKAMTDVPCGAYEISCTAFGEKRRPFSRWLNMAQTIACLEYLEVQNQVICHVIGNMLHYSRV